MLGIEASAVTLAVLWVCVGGTLLSVLFLWLEFHSGQELSRPLSGIFSAAFFGTAVTLWLAGNSADVFVPFVLLATFCLAVRAAYSQRVRHFAKRHAKPKLIWGLVLLASGVTSAYLTLHINAPDPSNGFPGNSESVVLDVEGIEALTDTGRKIGLFHFGESETVEDLERTTLAADLFAHQIIRLGNPDEVSNCHGWIFTGGQYGVHGRFVETILADNGYVEVPEALAGDVVIYRTAEGEITHTGVVRLMGADGLKLVESKWGIIGVYIHPPEATPFGSNFSFYRSPRKGHLLRLPPDSSTVIRTTIATTNGAGEAVRFFSTERDNDQAISRGAALWLKRSHVLPRNGRRKSMPLTPRHRFVAGGGIGVRRA
jgi:hypothetical protein